jgi:3-dehydroquinate synthase
MDVNEDNIRMILNFGHTIGHALESYFKFTGISHGEAVYHGMIAASYISMKKGYLKKNNFDKINHFINTIPKASLPSINVKKLLEYIQYDKSGMNEY